MSMCAQCFCSSSSYYVLQNALKIFENTKLDPVDIASMVDLITDDFKNAGEVLMKEGEMVSARLALVRDGKVKIESADGKINKTLQVDTYFGEEMLSHDATSETLDESPMCVATYTATVLEDANLAYLSLLDCRDVIDTSAIGKGKKENVFTNSLREDVKYEDLKKHAILGQGTFVQVWLVSSIADKVRRPYALKIQSKYELVQSQQVIDDHDGGSHNITARKLTHSALIPRRKGSSGRKIAWPKCSIRSSFVLLPHMQTTNGSLCCFDLYREGSSSHICHKMGILASLKMMQDFLPPGF